MNIYAVVREGEVVAVFWGFDAALNAQRWARGADVKPATVVLFVPAKPRGRK